jgi:tight adherence protein C
MARTTSPTSFLATKVVAAACGFVTGGLLGVAAGRPGRALLLAVVFAAAGFLIPDMTLTMKTRARREQIRAQLPDALDILAISVETGLGFDAALAKVAEHMDGPLVEELRLTLAEMRLGESRQDALRGLADRVDLAEVSSFVHAIVQAEQLGSPLGKILRVQATESRQKRQVAAEERAMKAPVKMIIPTAILIFPAMFIVILGPAILHFTQAF